MTFTYKTEKKIGTDRGGGLRGQGFTYPQLVVEIWGPLALFTRPEAKTERVSYPVPTPNAAAGMLRSVYWKPEFQYIVTGLEVLNPPAWQRITRNEVDRVVTQQWVSAAQRDPAVRFDAAQDRDQRSAVFLKDVRYRIHAQIRPLAHARTTEEGYREQLRRRVERGACFNQPCLGTRECVAEGFGPPSGQPACQAYTDANLGPMLHSIEVHPNGAETYTWYVPTVERGVIVVPLEGLRLPAGRGGREPADAH